MKRAIFIIACNYRGNRAVRELNVGLDMLGLGGFFKHIANYDIINMVEDKSREVVLAAMDGLLASLNPGDLLVIYFGGHGIQRGETSLLVLPPGAHDRAGAPFGFLSVPDLRRRTDARGLERAIILDCCRNDDAASDAVLGAADQFSRRISSPGATVRDIGVGPVNTPTPVGANRGSCATFCACSEGEIAPELGDSGQGLFSTALQNVLTRAKESNQSVRVDDTLREQVEAEMGRLAEERKLAFTPKPWKAGNGSPEILGVASGGSQSDDQRTTNSMASGSSAPQANGATAQDSSAAQTRKKLHRKAAHLSIYAGLLASALTIWANLGRGRSTLSVRTSGSGGSINIVTGNQITNNIPAPGGGTAQGSSTLPTPVEPDQNPHNLPPAANHDQLDVAGYTTISLCRCPPLNSPASNSGRKFFLSTGAITNAQFQSFVAAKPYRTYGEKYLDEERDIFPREPTSGGARETHPNALTWRDYAKLPAAQDLPVVLVTREDAIAFCDWASENSGQRVRLMTSDEWTWATRLGDDNYWPSPSPKSMNLADQSLQRTVGKLTGIVMVNYDDQTPFLAPARTPFQPNQWGLFHMLGNQWQWTSDPSPTIVGGSWADPKLCVSSPTQATETVTANTLDDRIGFRILVEIP